MKKIVGSCLLLFSVSALGADVDYSYCSQKFNSQGFGTFPFSIEKNGKIKTADNVKLTIDEKNRQEILEYKAEAPYDMSMKVVITRDEKGQLSQIIQQSDFKAIKTKSGIGTNMPNNFQMGFGMGGFGMMGNQDSSSKNVFDLKIQNGKCFVARSYGDSTMGNHTHSGLYEEAQICRDISQFLKKNPNISSCFGESVGKKISGLFKQHKERNKDLYENKEKPQEGWGGGSMGYPGSGFNGGGYGGYGMMESLDQIINTSDAVIPGFGKAPIVDLIKVHQRCTMFNSTNAGLISEDEALWKKEVQAQAPAKDQDSTQK